MEVHSQPSSWSWGHCAANFQELHGSRQCCHIMVTCEIDRACTGSHLQGGQAKSCTPTTEAEERSNSQERHWGLPNMDAKFFVMLFKCIRDCVPVTVPSCCDTSVSYRGGCCLYSRECLSYNKVCKRVLFWSKHDPCFDILPSWSANALSWLPVVLWHSWGKLFGAWKFPARDIWLIWPMCCKTCTAV